MKTRKHKKISLDTCKWNGISCHIVPARSYVGKGKYAELLVKYKNILVNHVGNTDRLIELKKAFDELQRTNDMHAQSSYLYKRNKEKLAEEIKTLEDTINTWKEVDGARKLQIEELKSWNESRQKKLKFWRTGAWIATAAFAIMLIMFLIK